MNILKLQSITKFNEDIYIMRIRPSYNDVLLNGGYKRIHIVDCSTGNVKKSYNFPDSVKDFAIHKWVTSPDGNKSYLFTNDNYDNENYSIEVNHLKGISRKIRMPSIFDMHGEFYCFSNHLYLIGRGGNHLLLKDDSFIEYNGDLPIQPSIQKLENKIGPISKYNIIKMDMNYNGFYIVGNRPLITGYVSLNGEEIITNIDWEFIDISRNNDILYICYEHQVVQIKKDESIVILEADPNEYFISINVLSKDNIIYLNVLSSANDDPEISWLRTYYI